MMSLLRYSKTENNFACGLMMSLKLIEFKPTTEYTEFDDNIETCRQTIQGLS